MNHAESFGEWHDEIIEPTGECIWIPPPRNLATGKRTSIGPYRPIATRYLNWRWWLAELPMRWLARHMAKVDSVKERQGEEYIGHHADGLIDPADYGN